MDKDEKEIYRFTSQQMEEEIYNYRTQIVPVLLRHER